MGAPYPQPTDLTLLESVKAWVFNAPASLPGGGWPTASDPAIGGLISNASRMALTYMQRPTLLAHAVDEIRSGVGNSKILLKQYPLLGPLTALYVGGTLIPPRPSLRNNASQPPVSFPGGPAGWVVENPWTPPDPGRNAVVIGTGYGFPRGEANIEVLYNAGYAILGEDQTVPWTSAYTLAPAQPYGRFAADFGVTYADGTALTAVAASPTQGQYVPPAAYPATTASYSVGRFYTFAAADAAQAVLLSYSYVPADIDYAVMKWTGESYKYKERIGEKSKVMPQGQGTATWQLVAMPDDVKMVLDNYRSKIPVSL